MGLLAAPLFIPSDVTVQSAQTMAALCCASITLCSSFM